MKNTEQQMRDFIRESNRIEGIIREPNKAEVDEFKRFMSLDDVSPAELEAFVSIYQPGASIRMGYGMDVIVGNHRPMPGGAGVMDELSSILVDANDYEDPYLIHHRYETLHPFMDGNGRSGRMLWAWQVQDLSLGFLHRFYYQALSYGIDK